MKPRKLTPDEWEALRDRVFTRDGERCMAVELDPEPGPCGQIFGRPISDRRGLTIEHVSPFATLGKRAPDTEEFLLTLCYVHNVGPWASAHRHEERMHLAALYPDAWADVPEVQA